MANGKVVCVTGSGRMRLGWYVADACARRGYAVALHYRTAAKEAQESVRQYEGLGIDAAAFQADLTDERAVHDLFQRVSDRFGRLDLLVNCAAIWAPLPLEQLTAADIRQYFDVNTLSTFLCAQRAGLLMVGQPEGGCIVNVGDWATVRPYLDHAAYFISKAAIPTLTRVLAVELAHRNPRIRVNCILPGPVMMPPSVSEQERGHVIAATLVKREGSPQNVAQAVLAMAENDFVTGACLPVDGGRSIYAP
jgi:pteridine reductase